MKYKICQLPELNCSWLRPDGLFQIGLEGDSHTDYIRNNVKHIKCMDKPTSGDTDYTAIRQFMLETKFIRSTRYSSKFITFQKIQPFTKDQRNTIKDLEIFGYTCKVEEYEIFDADARKKYR